MKGGAYGDSEGTLAEGEILVEITINASIALGVVFKNRTMCLLECRRQQAWSGARSRRAATSPWSIAGTSTGTWLWSCAKSVKRQRGWSLARIRTGLCKTS